MAAEETPTGSCTFQTLEEYANCLPCKGEKLISATPYSMLSDRFYGQRLVLDAPFRNMEEQFCVQEIMA